MTTGGSSSAKAVGLTEQDSVNLLGNWLSAKARVFASPFDRSVAENYTTDTILYDIVKPEGSIDWLRNNNAYYEYGQHNVEPLGGFASSENEAKVRVKISQDIKLYVRGRLDKSERDVTDYVFTLRKVGSSWKISSRQKI
jgi:hypothetical protein